MLFRRNIEALSDEQLISRYQQDGDTACVAILFERYTDLVFLTCMKYLKNEIDSEDAVMQIFEKLILKLKQYEIKTFKYWLHTVTKNHCLVVLERQQKQRDRFEAYQSDLSQQADIHESEAVVPEAMRREKDIQQLEHAMNQLNVEQKTCLELFFLKHKKYQEIAEETGYSLKQVKSYIQNGKRNLKKYLDQQISTINE